MASMRYLSKLMIREKSLQITIRPLLSFVKSHKDVALYFQKLKYSFKFINTKYAIKSIPNTKGNIIVTESSFINKAGLFEPKIYFHNLWQRYICSSTANDKNETFYNESYKRHKRHNLSRDILHINANLFWSFYVINYNRVQTIESVHNRYKASLWRMNGLVTIAVRIIIMPVECIYR